MKQYQKAQMLAKNLPTGSYAAGCGENQRASFWNAFWDNASGVRKDGSSARKQCLACERTQ